MGFVCLPNLLQEKILLLEYMRWGVTLEGPGLALVRRRDSIGSHLHCCHYSAEIKRKCSVCSNKILTLPYVLHLFFAFVITWKRSAIYSFIQGRQYRVKVCTVKSYNVQFVRSTPTISSVYSQLPLARHLLTRPNMIYQYSSHIIAFIQQYLFLNC